MCGGTVGVRALRARASWWLAPSSVLSKASPDTSDSSSPDTQPQTEKDREREQLRMISTTAGAGQVRTRKAQEGRAACHWLPPSSMFA